MLQRAARESHTSSVLVALMAKAPATEPAPKPSSYASNSQLSPSTYRGHRGKKPNHGGRNSGRGNAGSNNNNSGSHGITHLGNNRVLGIAHLTFTQSQIRIDQIMVLSLNKVEFLGPNLSRLLSMLILPALLTLKVLSAPSILLSQTPLGTWTPEPPLT